MKHRVSPRLTEKLAFALLWLGTLVTLSLLVLFVGVILGRGLPHLDWDFLAQTPLEQGRGGGVLPMLAGSLYVAATGVAVATPLGVGTALYLGEFTRSRWLPRLVRFGAELLSGVPSIVFGLFGFALFVMYLGLGLCVLSGGLTLAAMILPTIVRTSVEAIRRVPRPWREVSGALGATRLQTVTQVVLPAALPGIATGVVLGLGRGLAETAALILTAGSALELPTSPLSPARTLSVHLYVMAREGISPERAYATASLLVVALLGINALAYAMMHRLARVAR